MFTTINNNSVVTPVCLSVRPSVRLPLCLSLKRYNCQFPTYRQFKCLLTYIFKVFFLQMCILRCNLGENGDFAFTRMNR